MTRIRLAKRAFFAANRAMILIFLFAGLLEYCLASHLGSKCQHDMDCTDFIKGSTCSMNGYCECAPYFVQYNVTTCLSSQLLGGDCILADQCTMKVANSSCLDGACRCVEGFLQFRKHTCLGPAHPGAVCYSHAHCQMNDKRSHCDFLIPNLFGRCQCTAPAKQYGGTCVGADENAIENDAVDSQTATYLPKITPPPTVFRPIDLISHYESTTQGRPLTIVEEVVLPVITEVPTEISKLPDEVTSASSEHAGGEDLTSDNESLEVLNNFHMTGSTSAPGELVQQATISDDYPYQIDNEEQVEVQSVIDESMPVADVVEDPEPMSEDEKIDSNISTEHHGEDQYLSEVFNKETEQESAPMTESHTEAQPDILANDEVPATEQQMSDNDDSTQEQDSPKPDVVADSNSEETDIKPPIELPAEIISPVEIQGMETEKIEEAEMEEVASQTEHTNIAEQNSEENAPEANTGLRPDNEGDDSLKEPVYIEESHSRPSSAMHVPEEPPIIDEEAETHIDMYGEMSAGGSQENKDVTPEEEELGSGDSITLAPVMDQQKITFPLDENADEPEIVDMIPETNEGHDTDDANIEDNMNKEDQEQTTQGAIESQTIINDPVESNISENNDQLQNVENLVQLTESETERTVQESDVETPEEIDEKIIPIINDNDPAVEQHLSEDIAIRRPEDIVQPALAESEEQDINQISENQETGQQPEFGKIDLVEGNPAVVQEVIEEEKPTEGNMFQEQNPHQASDENEATESPIWHQASDENEATASPIWQHIQEEEDQENADSTPEKTNDEEKLSSDLHQEVLENEDPVTESHQYETSQAPVLESEEDPEDVPLPTLEEENEDILQKQELIPKLETLDQSAKIQPIQETHDTIVDEELKYEVEPQLEKDEQSLAQEGVATEQNISEESPVIVQLLDENEQSVPLETTPIPTQEVIQESLPETESDVEQDTVHIRLQDILPDESQEILQQQVPEIPQEIPTPSDEKADEDNAETTQPTHIESHELFKPNLLEFTGSDQPIQAASDEALSQENHLAESDEPVVTPSEHVEAIKSESSEESIQQVHDLEANIGIIEHETAQTASDNNPLASSDHTPNENLALDEEPISPGENVILESNEKIESDASLGIDPIQSNSVPEAQVATEIETKTEASLEDERTADKLENKPQPPEPTADFEITQNADHVPTTDAPTPVHPTFDTVDELKTGDGAEANVDISANELQTGVNTNENETTESVPLDIESETPAAPYSTVAEMESDYSEIEKFEQFEDHHLVDEAAEPEPVAIDWEQKLQEESEPQETTTTPLGAMQPEDDLKVAEGPQFNENESVLSILSGLMTDVSEEEEVTTIRPEQSIDDLNAEGTAHNEQTPAGNLYYPTILSELLLDDNSDESDTEEPTTPARLRDKDENSSQTVAPEELPFDLSFVSPSDRDELMSDNLVVETTPEPYNDSNDNKVTTEIPNILELTTQTMLGLASRVTLMEPAAPIVTTLKPYMPVEDDFSTTPSSQLSTDAFLNSKQEIRKRVELGNGPVSLGLRCNNDRQCQLADPYTVCNEDGVCDCASKRAAQAQCSAKRTGCSPGTFQCRSSGVCISWFFVCDGRPDCTDASDEECTFSARLNQTCPSEAFRCEHSGRCISRAALCDGRKQCPHGEDEIKCNSLRTESGQCPPNTFHCNSGECLPEYEYCNAIISCKDGSDEPPHLCGSRSVPNIFLRLLTAAVVDGGTSSSNSDSSRTNIGGTNAYCPHRCSNGRCRSTAIVCSGRDGCGDGTDEETCSVCRCPAPAYISVSAELLAHQPPMPLWK